VATDAELPATITLLACEYVSLHADDTISVVRGGLDWWGLPQVPAQVSLVLMLVVPAGVLGPGEHDLRFRLTTASGAVTWVSEAKATVKDPRFSVRGAMGLLATIDSFGLATAEVACAAARGTATIDFREARP
jgi:hypothetical protein